MSEQRFLTAAPVHKPNKLMYLSFGHRTQPNIRTQFLRLCPIVFTFHISNRKLEAVKQNSNIHLWRQIISFNKDYTGGLYLSGQNSSCWGGFPGETYHMCCPGKVGVPPMRILTAEGLICQTRNLMTSPLCEVQVPLHWYIITSSPVSSSTMRVQVSKVWFSGPCRTKYPTEPGRGSHANFHCTRPSLGWMFQGLCITIMHLVGASWGKNVSRSVSHSLKLSEGPSSFLCLANGVTG